MYRGFNQVFQDFDYLQKEINNIFHHAHRGQKQTFPLINLYESDEKVTLVAELPGLKKEDIQISLLDKVLTLAGKREPKRYGEKVLALRQERSTGKFEKKLKIPFAIEAEAIAATFENGLLTVTLPKAEEAKPKKIEIQ